MRAGLRLRTEVLARAELRRARRRSAIIARVVLRLAEVARWRTVGGRSDRRAVICLLRKDGATDREQ